MGKKWKQPRVDEKLASADRVPQVDRAIRTAKDGHAVWQFNTRDLQQWTWDEADYEALLRRLADIEERGFADIRRRARSGREHHFIERTRICADAQRRLAQRKLDDVDEVFSIRIDQKKRAFAVVYGNHIACLLWWDPEHTVYPMNVTDN